MIFLSFVSSVFAAELYQFGPDPHVIFIEATLSNSDTPFLFSLNPGLSYSMLTENVISETQLPIQNFRGNTVSKSELMIDDVSIDSVFYVIDGHQNFPLWGGIIGGDVLEKFVVDIHLSQNKLTLKKEDSTPKHLNFITSREGLITSIQNGFNNEEIYLSFDGTPFALQQQEESSSFVFALDSYQLPQPKKSTTENSIGLSELKDARIILDMKNKKLAIKKEKSCFTKKRTYYTDKLKARYAKLPQNDSSNKRYVLAQIYIKEEKIDLAIKTLTTYLENVPSDKEAQETLYNLRIKTNSFPYETISKEEIASMVFSKNWIGVVNQLSLNGMKEKALEYASEGVRTAPDMAEAWVALSDAHLANNGLREARQYLAKAKTIDKSPNAYAIRSALLAYLINDREGSISYLRQQLNQPTKDEIELYVYARMFSDGNYSDIFTRDMQFLSNSTSDFRLLSLHKIVEDTTIESLYTTLLQQNCIPLKGDSRTNCEIWLNALKGSSSPKHTQKMRKLLKKHPYRSDYWDTLGVVYVEQNNMIEAKNAFFQAFIYNPDSPYMLFQYYWYQNL